MVFHYNQLTVFFLSHQIQFFTVCIAFKSNSIIEGNPIYSNFRIFHPIEIDSFQFNWIELFQSILLHYVDLNIYWIWIPFNTNFLFHSPLNFIPYPLHQLGTFNQYQFFLHLLIDYRLLEYGKMSLDCIISPWQFCSQFIYAHLKKILDWIFTKLRKFNSISYTHGKSIFINYHIHCELNKIEFKHEDCIWIPIQCNTIMALCLFELSW